MPDQPPGLPRQQVDISGAGVERWGPCECTKAVPGHDARCHLHAVDMTKAEFVEAAEGIARAAIETFLILEGVTQKQAVDIAIDESGESAACFAGIGSCGGGGCKHG